MLIPATLSLVALLAQVTAMSVPRYFPLCITKLLTQNSVAPSDHRNSRRATSNTWLENYEYVVVGSGAGGGPVAARLAIAGYKVLLIDAGNDQGSSYQQKVPALMLQSTEYEPMRWDYYVNHYQNLSRQERDSKMSYRTTASDLYVGLNPPAGATPLGILYPRSGTLGGCTAHNALITVLISLEYETSRS
jgi:choline dehydrogenase